MAAREEADVTRLMGVADFVQAKSCEYLSIAHCCCELELISKGNQASLTAWHATLGMRSLYQMEFVAYVPFVFPD